jgi:hypothetical protein
MQSPAKYNLTLQRNMNSLTLTNYILLSVITIVNVNLPNGDCRVEQDPSHEPGVARQRSLLRAEFDSQWTSHFGCPEKSLCHEIQELRSVVRTLRLTVRAIAKRKTSVHFAAPFTNLLCSRLKKTLRSEAPGSRGVI